MKRKNARPRYWVRALVQLLAICAALLLWAFARQNELYFSHEHKLSSILRRNLAQNAEIIYHIKPDDSEWSDADERLYLLRWGDDVGALRTMVTHKGNTVYGTQHDTVQRIILYDGVGIAPLYATNRQSTSAVAEFTRGVCAVVTTRDDVARVELRHYEHPNLLASYHVSEAQNGVFLFELDITPPSGHSYEHDFDLYNDLTRNYFGVTAYDKDGNVLVHIPSTSEKEHSYEN